ncbi:acyltransferase [Colwellia piezophila]|uniref:acyltransferase n=1 Tax=Colwellia piezophila TaxID=211668 RepID=UPI000376A03D|nr:acyltransferase [Colwellia piezophila]
MIVKAISRLFRSLNMRKLKQCGKGSVIKKGELFSPENLHVGDYVYIGPGHTFYCHGKIYISDGSIIGPNVTIWSVNHNYRSNISVPYDNIDYYRKVTIGKGVWIGANVSIAPGTIIPDGCIISMGSVVSGKLTTNTVYAGNPAVVVKELPVERLELIENKMFYLKMKYSGKVNAQSFD